MSSTSYTGENLVITFGGTALQADFRTLTVTENVGDADGSSGADAYVRHLPTQTDANLSLELTGRDAANGTAMWAALAPEGTGQLLWFPDGSTSNYRYGSCNAYVASRVETVPYNDVVTWTVSFLPQTAITHSTVT